MLLSQSPVWRSTASTYQSRSDLVACTGMVGPAYSPTQRAKPGKLRQNRAKWGKRRPPPIQASETNDVISFGQTGALRPMPPEAISRPNTHADPRGRPLESWKEIAAYLGRDVTTVRRWERREGLPVYRILHSKLGSVYAYTTELDAWRDSRAPAAANRCRGCGFSPGDRSAWGSGASLACCMRGRYPCPAGRRLLYDTKPPKRRDPVENKVVGGIAPEKPVGRPNTGISCRRHDRSSHRAPLQHSRSTRHLPHLRYAVQEHSALRAGNRQNSSHRRHCRRLGHTRRRPHSRSCAAHSRRH